MTLILRPGEAKPGDWRRRISEAVAAPRGLFLAAESGGALVGNLGLWPDANPASAHVAWIGMSVADGYRGVGVGVAPPRDGAAGPPAPASAGRSLGVFPDNARAIAFYERHGFVREGCAARSTAAATAIMTRCSWLVLSQSKGEGGGPPSRAARPGDDRHHRPSLFVPAAVTFGLGWLHLPHFQPVGAPAAKDTTSIEGWTVFAAGLPGVDRRLSWSSSVWSYDRIG